MHTDYYIHDEKVKARNETAAERLASMAHMMAPSDSRAAVARHSGRNFLARTMDTMLTAVRKYAPPIHWLVVAVGATLLLIYIRLVAFTARLKSAGERRWPDVRAPSVIALWHRDAPSLLVAFAKRRPHSQSMIMIARDARGDTLALLCRMLGFRVVRGGTNGGWNALTALAKKLEAGACVFITADGGGPARVAKVGAVALAAAAGVPLLPIAADCSPAIEERHKWDSARNPIPFGSVTVSIGSARSIEPLVNLASIEQARHWLEETLNALATQDA